MRCGQKQAGVALIGDKRQHVEDGRCWCWASLLGTAGLGAAEGTGVCR